MSEHPSLEVLVDQACSGAAKLTQEEAQRWFHHMEAALEALEHAPSEQILPNLEAVALWGFFAVARQAWPDEPLKGFEWEKRLHKLYREAVQRVTPQQQRQVGVNDPRRSIRHEYYHHHGPGRSRGIGL